MIAAIDNVENSCRDKFVYKKLKWWQTVFFVLILKLTRPLLKFVYLPIGFNAQI